MLFGLAASGTSAFYIRSRMSTQKKLHAGVTVDPAVP